MMKILCVCIAALLGLAALGSCGGPKPEAFTGTTTTSAPAIGSASEPATEITSTPTTSSQPTSSQPTTVAPTTKALPTVKMPADNVTLTTQEQTYPVGTEEITATWHRGADENPDDAVIYGASFHLQKWDGGAWVEMEPINKLMFLLWGAMLNPGESGEVTYDIGHYYGPLQAGRYRIAAYFNYDSERPVRQNDPRHEVFAEITVK